MPKRSPSTRTVAEICARLIRNESQSSIAKRVGVAVPTVRFIIDVLLDNGLTVVVRPQSRLDPGVEEAAQTLFRTGDNSNRQIARLLGVNLNTINRCRVRYNAEATAAGIALPRCECGKDLHHPRICWARHRQDLANRQIASVFALPKDRQSEVRQLLISGESTRQIGNRVGLAKHLVQSFLRSLAPEERNQRREAIRTDAGRRRAMRHAKKIPRPASTDPRADLLYARIARLIPAGTDPSLRDDMISQAYLDVMMGNLTEERLAEGVRKVRSRTYQSFANRWGDRSLDEERFEDGGGTLMDTLADDRALEAFEAIE